MTCWFNSSRNVGIRNQTPGILTGQIFGAAKPVENRRFYGSKAANEKAVILTFILTLRFWKI
jgi:hypothetical protein